MLPWGYYAAANELIKFYKHKTVFRVDYLEIWNSVVRKKSYTIVLCKHWMQVVSL